MQKIYQDLKFPEGFLWGAATSAHQVEGDNINNWSEWEKSEKRIKYLKERGLAEKYGIENYISGKTCGHYDLFEKDFEMAKSLGHNVTRFSIEWSRIEPKEGEFNEKELEHYKKVVKCLKNLGLEPMISLWHWPIPLWLESRGGWRGRGIEKYFTHYVEKVVKFLGDDVRFWITLNEPEIYASNSYLRGIWPPQKINIFFIFLRFK